MTTATTPAAPTARRTRRKPGEPLTPIVLPFTIIQDSREISGGGVWTFTGITGVSGDQYRSLVVPTEIATLKTGDYSVRGMEHLVTVERKECGDLFGSLVNSKSDPTRRDRFEAEHQRMAAMIRAGGRAVVVIESDWATMLANPPYPSRLSPLSVFRTAISWLVKYNVPWIACPGRRFAELTTFGILRKFYEVEVERMKVEI